MPSTTSGKDATPPSPSPTISENTADIATPPFTPLLQPLARSSSPYSTVSSTNNDGNRTPSKTTEINGNTPLHRRSRSTSQETESSQNGESTFDDDERRTRSMAPSPSPRIPSLEGSKAEADGNGVKESGGLGEGQELSEKIEKESESGEETNGSAEAGK